MHALHAALPLFLALAACAATAPQPRVLLYGEQHDQPDQQRQVARAVRELASAGMLAAVVVEMAEGGAGAAALPSTADEAAVQQALYWSAAAWPWDRYREVVMSAVRAGVPVLGGNLPRSAMGEAMDDAGLEQLLPQPANALLVQAIRDGHCGRLPVEREGGMLRIQVARDRAMARTLAEALQAAAPGRQVLLLAGAQHAARDRGVPLHLQQLGLQAQALRVTLFGEEADRLPADRRLPAAFTARPDPCASLKNRRAKTRGLD